RQPAQRGAVQHAGPVSLEVTTPGPLGWFGHPAGRGALVITWHVPFLPASGALRGERRAACLQAGDRHPERRAGHIIQAHLVEEVDRIRVTAVLAAHAELDVRPGLLALLDGDLDQAAYAVAVDRLERRDAEDTQLDVPAEERALHVVPGEPPGHLRQVVRAEGEELRGRGDRARVHRGARHLDHGADQGVHVGAGLFLDLLEDLLGALTHDLHLLHGGGERDHDLRTRVLTGLLELGGRVCDRADLHLEQAGDDQAEPDAAQAEHRVLLVQPAYRGEQYLVLLRGRVAGQGDLDGEFGEVGQELVQRRVDQPDRGRQAVHGVQDLHEVAALQRLQGVQRVLAPVLRVGQDQVLDQLAAPAEEHGL